MGGLRPGPGGMRPGFPTMGPPGMVPGVPGQPGGQPIPGAANPNAKGQAPELNLNPEALPENYAPPPATKDKIMTEEVRLAEPAEIDKLKKDLAKYQNVLRKPIAGDAEKALIRNGIRYRLALMCLKEVPGPNDTVVDNRKNLSKLHDDLLRDMNSAASVPETANAAQVKSFRQMVLQELVNQAAPLLANQNFYVRLHIAILLGELDLTKEDPKLNFKQEAFAPPADPLVKVILDPQQPEAVKVAAVNGLVRILRLGNPNIALRTKVAQALVAELNSRVGPGEKEKNHWYQMRLAGAMSVVDVDLDEARKPFVVNVLLAVMADAKRTWAVRSEAAKSLGRVPLPPACNPPSVTQAVAAFALQLAKAAQLQPPSKADDPRWRSEFIKVYLAFQPLDANDLTADKKSKAGLLNNPAAAAKTAYGLIVPMVAAILHGQRLTVQQVQMLEAYIVPNPPPAQTAAPTLPKNNLASETKGGESAAPGILNASGPKQ